MEINFHASKKSVLESISCLDAAYALGLRAKIKGRYTYVECPFHTSRIGKPDKCIGNCKISDNGKNCYCFSCNGSGNAIEMVMAYKGLNFCEATDWLAQTCAPELLSDEWKIFTPKKICPYTKEQFDVIGIHTESTPLPVNMVSSKKTGRENANYGELLYEESLHHQMTGSEKQNGNLLLCTRSQLKIQEIYQEDQKIFYEIIIPKAKAAHKKYMKMFKKTKMLPQNDLTILILEELSKKIKTTELFIEDGILLKVY